MEFRSLHTVETPENIVLKLELSGLSSRVFAFLIDGMVMLVLMGLVLVLMGLPLFRAVPDLPKTVLPLGLFLIFFCYHMLQEWLWNGRTLGKAIFSIRVVRNNGQPIGFWEAFGRNLLRVVDVYVSGIGFVIMLLNRDEKRLGDFLAGTVVISDQALQRSIRPWKGDAGSPAMAFEKSGEASELIRLSDEETELLRAYQARRDQLFPDARTRLSESLCRYFEQRLGRPLSSETELDLLLS